MPTRATRSDPGGSVRGPSSSARRPLLRPLAGAAVLEARYDPAIDLDLDGGASDRDAPVLVRGFVDGDQGTEVAVAVNGTVAATTTVMEDHSFAVLIDPSLYTEGSNRMEVFRIPRR